MLQLKLFIKAELERRLSMMPGLGYDGEAGNAAPVKIATITFAYDNAKVIQWLKTRGDHIKNENWKKLDEINATI